MRFLVLMRGDEDAESGELPNDEIIAEMQRFNDELARSGVLLAAEGLRPSTDGARVHLKDGRTTVLDGPFAEAKEVIAGFWILQVHSREEAVEWVKRMPNGPGADTVIELRQIFDLEDFEQELAEAGRDLPQ
jgi:hypothetical protein